MVRRRRRARRLAIHGAILMTSALGCLSAEQTSAHDPAIVTVASPREGRRVASPVSVRLVGSGAFTEPASFTLLVDGEVIDVRGKRGAAASIFRSHRLASGEDSSLEVDLPSGSHELRVVYAADSDRRTPDIVRRFEVGTSGSSAVGPVSLLAATSAVAAAVVVRRRVLRRHEEGHAG